jgi:hypothetical protein
MLPDKVFHWEFCYLNRAFVNICVKNQQMQCLVSSDVMHGDLRSPRTTSLDTARPSTIFYQLLIN